ncbi:ornithine carbamoyltransferase [Bacillus badius]|uniref:Ornithine carbamoyltransferase n=1 Tax=Bacillus badius TaxID=1455 RepID=A0ABR5AQF2_BACBA|nr:ornithine carbamoyltransferase [Bacillus badius]KIL72214.1 Ornithine carbamoyltransferase [Bacillus badius]KIL76978.1 Ornithine carbamoyltransferase [Bacillus badius]KZR58161.1 ornithine carbamoyltransferase [Bacillus badius]MED4718444.1 ornithine carbamoyltransferase [Bacillus badius]
MLVTDIKNSQELKGKDLLKLADYTPETIETLVYLADDMKKNKEKYAEALKGQLLGMIFEKHSTRTRVSFEAAMIQLGGHGMFLSANDMQIGRGETIEDTGKVLAGYLDGIMIRTHSHSRIEALAEAANIPVINGLTDLYHPCQALADLLTVYEIKGKFKGSKMVYVGDGNNVAHSLMIGAVMVGMDFTLATPAGYEAAPQVVEIAKGISEQTGAKLEFVENPEEAVKDADFIYTDVWTSMGQEEESAIRLQAFAPYQVNEQLMSFANPDCKFMHCLPAHRGEEVSAGIMDGTASVVFQQAENRMHAQKAVLYSVMKK